MTSTVWIEKLKVSELKEELKKHGLPVSGKKVDLVERLRAHLESKEPQEPANEEENAEEEEDAPAAVAPPTTKQTAAGVAVEKQKEKEQEEAVAEPMEVEQPVDAAEPATAADDDTLPNGFGLIPTTTTVQETIKPAVENKKNKSSDAMEIDNKQQQEKSKPAPLQKKKPPPPSTTAPLTMADISRDELTRLSEEKWSSRVLESGSVPTFDLGLVEKIYTQELGGGQGTPPPAGSPSWRFLSTWKTTSGLRSTLTNRAAMSTSCQSC